MKVSIVFLLLNLVSLGGFSQHDHGTHSNQEETEQQPQFNDKKFATAYEHYTHLKDALVGADHVLAKNSAAQLQKSLALVADGKKAMTAAAKLVAAAGLEEQRVAFSTLSDEMTLLVKNNTPSSGSVYIQYCPMANANKGGYWLSNKKIIMNPYFGDRMLKCGTVKETIQ